MDPEIERKRNTLINAAYAVLVLAVYYVFFRYVIYAVMPFFIAAVITLLLKKPIDKLSKITRIPKKGVGAFILFIFYGVIAVLIVLGVVRLVGLAGSYLTNLPQIYTDSIEPAVSRVLNIYEDTISKLNPNMLGYLQSVSNIILEKLGELAASLSKVLVSLMQNVVLTFPSILIGVTFCIIATVIMTLDVERIDHFLLGQFSAKNRALIKDAAHYLEFGVVRIIGSYLLLMVITFLLLLISFKVIGLSNIVAIAAIIAITDLLPILGVGTILIPWALIDFLNGNFTQGLEMLAIYGFIFAVRQVIEPKIVGKSVGVHPVIILMSMYLGTKIFGGIGLVVLPFTVIVVKNLNDTGRIDVFHSDYMEQAERRKALSKDARKERKEKREEKREEKRNEKKAEVCNEPEEKQTGTDISRTDAEETQQKENLNG